MSEPLQPGLFIDGRGRICELREVGGTWQHPSTTTEPQCLTYPPERLIPESQVRAQVEAARRDTLNQAAADMPTGSGTTASYWDGVRVEYVIYERSPNDLTPQTWLRDQAARGETRQP